MLDYYRIIEKYYSCDNKLKQILISHSISVRDKALGIVDKHPELKFDRNFVEAAVMLHDIGICFCNAPGIECKGEAPYICHGSIGARLLREEGIDERFARVCERHTGAGLTLQNVIDQKLPIETDVDLLPETLDEKLICYADKFFSKTHLDKEKTFEQAKNSLRKFGEDGVKRFEEWHKLFDLQ